MESFASAKTAGFFGFGGECRNDRGGRNWATRRRSSKIIYFEIVDERAACEYWSLKPLLRSDRKIVAIAGR
jgi:hypothetical protein